MSKPNYHFFLGGKDLEMAEISKMLEANGHPFDDAQMQWGAAVSGYGDRVSQVAAAGKTPVLIELGEDAPLPKSAISVDHHGDRSKEPASIAQVANLIGVELTRDQRLVAANDSGYINGMKREGATSEEIADIRMRDRAAQGVTAEHEAQAEAAIEAEGTIYSPDDLAVVRCEHSKVAPIMDRYRAREDGGPKGILVLSADGEVNYSGPGHIAKKLADYFPENSWSGGEGLGNPDGEAFFGANAGKASLAIHAAAVAFTHLDEIEAPGRDPDLTPTDFYGYHPWFDREQPHKTLSSNGGHCAVQLSHKSGSPVPARIWRENGGSFTQDPQLPDGFLDIASEGLNTANPKDAETQRMRIERMKVFPLDYARKVGVSREIMSEIRQGIVEEKARGQVPEERRFKYLRHQGRMEAIDRRVELEER